MTEIEITDHSCQKNENKFNLKMKKIAFGFFNFVETIKIYLNKKIINQNMYFKSELSKDIEKHNKSVIDNLVDLKIFKNLSKISTKLKIDKNLFFQNLNNIIQKIDFVFFEQFINSIESNFDLLFQEKKETFINFDFCYASYNLQCPIDELKNILFLKLKRKDDLLIFFSRMIRKRILETFRDKNKISNRTSIKNLTDIMFNSLGIKNENLKTLFLTNKISSKHISLLLQEEKLRSFIKSNTDSDFLIWLIKKKCLNLKESFNYSKKEIFSIFTENLINPNIKIPWNLNEILNSAKIYFSKEKNF